MNLPNGLSLFRIFLVPVLVAVLLVKFEYYRIFGFSIFLLASITDLLDGYLARKRSQVTPLGKLLDPLADKLLVSAAFISLVELKAIPAWMVVIILCREFAVTGLRNFGITRGIVISASNLGKSKMLLQVIAICFLILGDQHIPYGDLIGIIVVWVAIVFAVVSSFEYFTRFARQGGFRSDPVMENPPGKGTQ